MKKRNDVKKEVKKIKKTEDTKVNRRRNQSEPDLWKEIRSNWKEIRSNLKPLGKAYNKFKGKTENCKRKKRTDKKVKRTRRNKDLEKKRH